MTSGDSIQLAVMVSVLRVREQARVQDTEPVYKAKLFKFQIILLL